MIAIRRFLRTLHRVREDDEAGFSIVELMASLMVLAIGIVSMLGTLVVAARASGVQRGRVNAVYAANLAFETIRSRPYDAIAICACDPDLAISPTTQTATTGAVRTDDPEASVPVRPDPIDLAGVRYTITQNILWVAVDDPITGKYYEQAYKLAVVRVSWRDHVGAHQIQLESAIYPGGGEAEESCGQSGPIPSIGVDGDGLSATASGVSTPSIDVGWRDTDNECSYTLQYLVLPSQPLACRGAGWEPQWITASELPADSRSYLFAGQWDRWYCFRIKATNRDFTTDWTYSNPVQTSEPPSQRCLLGSATIRSPVSDPNAPLNRVQIDHGTGYNLYDMIAAVEYVGACNRIWAEFVTRRGEPANSGDFILTGLQGFIELPAGWQRFDLGYGTVTFKAQGDEYGGDVTVSVCYYRGGGGRPSC